jgi:hypothetical protein
MVAIAAWQKSTYCMVNLSGSSGSLNMGSAGISLSTISSGLIPASANFSFASLRLTASNYSKAFNSLLGISCMWFLQIYINEFESLCAFALI